jgi:hypothetical protein
MKDGAGKLAIPLLVGVALSVLIGALGTELIGTRRILAEARQEAAALKQWQDGILAQLNKAERPTTDVGARLRLNPADAPEALADLIAQRDTASEMLRLSSSEGPTELGEPSTGGAPTGSPRPTALNGITQLKKRESSGVAGQDAAAIENDSKAPWGGWK